jgi:hypothetical protein
MEIPKALSGLAGLPLAEIARLADDQKLPPVDRWNPAYCGHSGIRIASDGTWYHEGGAIRRAELVRLFSRVLRREPDGRYMLVTPGEMLDIDVEDLPFVAVELSSGGSGETRRLAFRLKTGDPVVAGPNPRITVGDDPGDPRPALHVRGGLEARIARPVYYELAELALEESNQPPGLWSDGDFFALDRGQ